jgi:hypothetical protein
METHVVLVLLGLAVLVLVGDGWETSDDGFNDDVLDLLL